MNNDLKVGAIYRKDTHIPIVGIVVALSSNGYFYGQEIWNAGADAEFHSRVARVVDQVVFMRDIVEVPAYVGGPMTDAVDHAVDTGDAFKQEEPRG